MHTQNTLHLTDAEFKFAIDTISSGNQSQSSAVIDKLVAQGIRRYPAEKLVEQYHNQLETA